MADWYVSSAAYATYTAFQISHAYSIGDIIVPTAPALKAKYVFRCTTAGTSAGSEPTWVGTNNSTTTSNTAIFTNISGQSTYAWTAAAGDLASIIANRPAAGDRFFISSDHTETQTAATIYGSAALAAGFSLMQFLCVNRAGSVPPVAADLTTGAVIQVNNQLVIESTTNTYHYGITYAVGSSSNLQLGSTGAKTAYFQNCQLWLNTSTTTVRLIATSPTNAILNNTTVKFGSTSQSIAVSTTPFNIHWFNTASAIAGATIPTGLFNTASGNAPLLVICRGVDLSAITGTLATNATSPTGSKYLFDSCKIASGVTRYSSTNAVCTGDLMELVNCYDGSSILSEAYQVSGAVTTEFTITLSGGATDDVGLFSHKMVSNANIDKFANTLDGFWLDVENTSTGSSKTATVEIISSTTLNNDEISLTLEYEGTSGSSVASFGTTFVANVLTTAAAVTSSSASWNSSPATPQKQKLQVTFTPQHAGRVRGRVQLGKASTTVYYNPQIIVT